MLLSKVLSDNFGSGEAHFLFPQRCNGRDYPISLSRSIMRRLENLNAPRTITGLFIIIKRCARKLIPSRWDASSGATVFSSQ